MISRREILKNAGAATLLPLGAGLAGAAAVTAAHAAPDGPRLAALDPERARSLLAAARTLFPHDFLGDAPYLKVVAAIDARMSADREFSVTVRSALDALPGHFAALPESAREAQLRSLEGSPFFVALYQETILGLYNDPAVWTLLGYEGSSIEFGGYLERGFDDISWLPSGPTAHE